MTSPKMISVMAPKGGRWRGGVFWACGAHKLPVEALGQEVIAALEGDAAFTVIAGDEARSIEAPDDEAVAAAIRSLGWAEFSKDNVPMLAAIRAGFGKEEAKLITAEQRDRVFGEMIERGFERPK